jgi:hypothetical protein
MKTIKFMIALMLFSNIFISCTNDQTDEELQTITNLQEIAEDGDTGGGDHNPPIEPPI